MGDMERGKSCDQGKRTQGFRRPLWHGLPSALNATFSAGESGNRAKRDFFSREIRDRPDLSVKAAGAALYRNEKWASIKYSSPYADTPAPGAELCAVRTFYTHRYASA